MEQVATNRRVLVLTGPTASGKTSVGVRLAELLGGEVISADSRQVYRGTDIGTAKPALEEQRGIPHHCIDIVDLQESYTAGHFARDAARLIGDIFNRGKQPIVVGGSGLYIQALTEGIFDESVSDPAVREGLEARLHEEGIDSLWDELLGLDPESGAFVPKTNIPRVIRALEVCMQTGEPFSKIRRERMIIPSFESVLYGLEWNRRVLYERINRRVTAMLEQGLVAEVRSLLENGANPEWKSLNTVGYKEVFRHLAGETTYELMADEIRQHTRNYAKRQLTWFRNKADVRWIQVDEPLDVEAAAGKIEDNFCRLIENGPMKGR